MIPEAGHLLKRPTQKTRSDPAGQNKLSRI